MRGLDVGGVGRGDGRLGHQEGGADLAVHQRLQPLLLLLVGAVAMQHFHVAGVGRRAVEDLRGPGDVAHLFRQQRIFEIGQSRAAEFVVFMRVRRHEHVPEAFGLRLLLQVFEDRDHLPARALRILLVVDRHRGADMRLHERLHAVQPFLLLFGHIEVHGALLGSGLLEFVGPHCPPASHSPQGILRLRNGRRIDISGSSNDSFIQLFELQLPQREA